MPDNEAAILARVLDQEIFIPTLIAVSIVSVVTIKTIAGVFRTRERERSRREIAAFIAEGSMTPEQGERLLRAGESGRSC